MTTQLPTSIGTFRVSGERASAPECATAISSPATTAACVQRAVVRSLSGQPTSVVSPITANSTAGATTVPNAQQRKQRVDSSSTTSSRTTRRRVRSATDRRKAQVIAPAAIPIERRRRRPATRWSPARYGSNRPRRNTWMRGRVRDRASPTAPTRCGPSCSIGRICVEDFEHRLRASSR